MTPTSRASTSSRARRRPTDAGGNLRLDFTEAQLEQLRQTALSRIADQIELNRDGRPTNDEIAQSLRDNHGVVEYRRRLVRLHRASSHLPGRGEHARGGA